MKDVQKFLPHIILAVTATAAFVILGVDHILTGGEVFGGIMGANGFTSAGVVASGSISTAATAAVDVSQSASAQTPNRSPTPSTQSQQIVPPQGAPLNPPNPTIS